LHGEVKGGFHVGIEAQEGLVDHGICLHDAFVELNVNRNKSFGLVTNSDSIFHGHEEWWVSQISNKVDANVVGSDILSALGDDFWEDLKDLV